MAVMKTGVLVKLGEEKLPFWPLLKPKIRIGRGPENDMVLAHPSVSRLHAEIERTADGNWQLADLDSRNGTRVNGVAVARRRLREGDLVSFGDVTLRFTLIEGEYGGAPKEEGGKRVNDYRPTMTAVGGSDPMALAWPGLQGWQMVRTLLEGGVRLPAEYAAAVLDDLCGWRDVRGAGIGLREGGEDRWYWVWSARAPAPFRRRAEEAVARDQVRERHSPYSAENRNAVSADPDFLQLPIASKERFFGFLILQAEYGFSTPLAAAFQAAADALGCMLAFSVGYQSSRGAPALLGRGAREESGIQSPAVVGRSPALQQALRLARKAAVSDATVLIRGETGTGKEVFARLIAAESRRNRCPFLPVHCSAIDETLLGSTLFGHEKGAFTGAIGMKRGVFEDADGGTVFLDEIGELTLGMQVKLLRVLQEGEFIRLGGNRPIRVDVRILAATNRSLERAVEEGTFREDLFYRLNVVPLVLPPLRDRREDLPDLIRHFLVELSEEMGRPVPTVENTALTRLQEYAWPGNIRELRNVLERALVFSENGRITEEDLPPELTIRLPSGGGLQGALAETERDTILRILRECGGNKRLAAQRLGISRSTLYERLREWTERAEPSGQTGMPSGFR